MSMMVNEIFYSIQGESLYAGLPCVFLRLTGCNLRCSYCDTRYAYAQGSAMTLPDIMAQIASYRCRLVEVTGGEPLLQAETPLLVQTLIESGYNVLVETNGTYDIGALGSSCIRIVDIKCPGSGESQKNKLHNLDLLNSKDQIKFVIGDRADYLYAREILKRIPAGLPQGHVLFSPVADRIASRRLAEWILQDRLQVRLQLQLHKIIWPDAIRGR